MPLKLNVGLSRKVGEPNYGSRGANINMEVEVESSLAGEPTKLHERIRRLFSLVRSALVEELSGATGHAAPGNGEAPPTNGQPANGQEHVNGPTNGRKHNAGNGSPRPATQSQISAILALAKGQGLDVDAFLKDRFQVDRPQGLTIKEASKAIDELKSSRLEGG